MACQYLIDQALIQFWSSPRQDVQHVIEPERITRLNGAWNTVEVLFDRYPLPEPNVRFHVYQVGQLYPTLLGLFPVQNQWVSLAENCNRLKMMVNIYSDKGIEMPRFSTWYMVTKDRNLLLAVKEQPNIDIDLNQEKLYFRVYSGAWFKGDNVLDMNEYVRVTGKEIKIPREISELKDEYERIRRPAQGLPLLYVNGRKTNVLNLSELKIGDCVEWVEDTSIYRYVEFNIENLPTFVSTRDDMRKYLLHYRLTENQGVRIESNDDVDFYIVRKDPEGQNPAITGFYYHRNKEEAVRNVTHRDFSLSTHYVGEFTKQETPRYFEDKSMKGWTVQMYIRKSGFMDRGIPFVHERLRELYKLPDNYLVKALLGIDSVVEEWKAAHLENSPYVRIMGWPDYSLEQRMVEDAFGYNAVTKLVGDTPSKVEAHSGRNVVNLPYMLQSYSSGFEYDEYGRLTSYHSHASGLRYLPRESNTQVVEMIGGYASHGLDETFNQVVSHWQKNFNYRFYRKAKTVDARWEDVTGEGVYEIDEENGQVRWLHDMNAYDCIVRSDKNILIQEEEFVMTHDLINIPFYSIQNRDGIAKKYLLEVPLLEVDVFLNGYSLVEGVDYHVDGNRVVIINKKHLNQPTTTQRQKVLIRSYGFPDKDFLREPKDDVGFVRYGVLSRNNRFDLRDDRVMRMTVGGRLIHRDDLRFSENDSSVGLRWDLEGQPYEIKDILVPFRDLIEQDHYQFRKRSQETDRRVSDYMSRFLVDKPKNHAQAIPDRWPVFSPYFSAVYNTFKRGKFKLSDIQRHYDDDFIRTYLAGFEDLLRVDPTQVDTSADEEFVIIHPTPYNTVIEIDVWLYAFLERVIKVMLNGRIDMTPFFRISNG